MINTKTCYHLPVPSPIAITAFYAFRPVAESDLVSLQSSLKKFGAANDMRGLVLLGTEGINGTVCGSPDVIDEWKKLVTKHFGDMNFNDSDAPEHVFPRWLVKIKQEIVALKQSDVRPNGEHKHLTPEEWNAMMEEDVVVIDARNTYETAIGMFEGAIDPKTQHFHQFAEFASKAELPKDKPIMMYCTGGIRCEKAIFEMEKNGYHNTYQLKGGILGYLKQFPHKKFKGECFVFDHRVSVDQELRPSERFGLCPHCGDPADRDITCENCDGHARICGRCSPESDRHTCSKRCRNEVSMKAIA